MDVQIAVTGAAVPAVAEMRRWAKAAMQGTGESAQLTLRIVDAQEGAELNERYRAKTGPTNVLSFPFEAPPGVPCELLGDVVVCAPVVEREAREQGKALQAHWAHMIVHGVLHLRGYDHQQAAQAEQMETLERAILQQLGYADPYAVAG